MKYTIILLLFSCVAWGQKEYKADAVRDTIYYNGAEGNSWFRNGIEKDSIYLKIQCSKDYLYCYKTSNPFEILVKEFYENGKLKSTGLLKAISPFITKQQDGIMNFLEFDKDRNIVGISEKSEIITKDYLVLVYYLEKYQEWQYFDESGNLKKVINHVLPDNPKQLKPKRYKEFCKKCDAYYKKHPNEWRRDLYIMFE